MKKLFLPIIIALFMIQSAYAQFNAKVDEKFELTSIVFALAGAEEYCETGIPSYAEDIQKYFEPYKSSEFIEYIKQIRGKYSIGYGSVCGTAEMLEIKNGKIRLQPQYDIAKISECDDRWNKEVFAKYLEMLNVFYKKSKFNKFFQNHKPLYDSAEQVISKYIAENIKVDWFKSFYGKDLDSNLNVYVSLTNGPSNYAISHGILLGVGSDENGMPRAGDYIQNLMIHEFSHIYVREMFDSYWGQMEDAANKIFPKVQEQMAHLAYGDAKSTINEWLVNLAGTMYQKEIQEKPSFIRAFIAYYTESGFIWLFRSVEFMDNFYANRDKYPTFKDFMPQLVGFLNYTADNFDLVEMEFEYRKPYIKSIYPAPGSDLTDAKEIVITFSEPMLGAYGFQGPADNTECLPLKESKWSDDRLRHILTLTPNSIKPGVTYGIKLHHDFFKSLKTNFSMDKKYIDLVFKQDLK